MESSNLKKLHNRFLDWKITFILHCGNGSLTDLYKRFLKFTENVPKYGAITNNSFSGSYCSYNLFRDVQFVEKLFDTVINDINRVIVTLENTSQEFYFYMKIFSVSGKFCSTLSKLWNFKIFERSGKVWNL